MSEFENKFDEEYQRQMNEIERPNLLVVGGTGVGKSSLIIRVFGDELDTKPSVGAGEPVTSGLNPYRPKDTPIILWDAEGYEISNNGNISNDNFKRNVLPKIDQMMTGRLSEQIHLVWYCISIANHRVTDFDLNNIQDFLDRNMKLAVVLTQCDVDDVNGTDAKKFKQIINERHNVPVFETSSEKELNLDIEKLISWSCDALPTENLKRSFIQAQKDSIAEKKKEAFKIVSFFSGTTAATAGLNPIPISDALLIAPQQLTMCIQITNIFWMGTGLSSSIKDFLGTQILSILGKQAAASLVKLIPIWGNIINAGVAGTITFGLGFALVEANAKALKDFLDKGKEPKWDTIFKSSEFIESVNNAMENMSKKK